MVYESIKPGPGGSISLMLTPLELIGRLAALIPPPRRHRHRYYGVLAPNAPLRGQVTALAGVPDSTPAADATESIAATAAPSVTPSRSSEETAEAPGEAEAILRRAARYAWALLLARINEGLVQWHYLKPWSICFCIDCCLRRKPFCSACRGLVRRARGLGLRLTTRGSTRPGRLGRRA